MLVVKYNDRNSSPMHLFTVTLLECELDPKKIGTTFLTFFSSQRQERIGCCREIGICRHMNLVAVGF